MKKINILTILVLATYTLFSQIAPDKYYIQFTDKNNSPYSIENPGEFLTQKAIARRNTQNIEITIQDIPVNPAYINGVAETGVTILNPTKWLNGVTIFTTDSLALEAIEDLPYVANIRAPKDRIIIERPKPFFENENILPVVAQRPSQKNNLFDYGNSYNQIKMLNGILLHESGFRGEGMIISVLDAGFRNVDNLAVFDSLWENDQIIGTRDFVDPGDYVFDYHSHGTSVLSTMGGNYPGELIGTAPKAQYYLLRSEEAAGKAPENIIEEYNWVSAAEFADSVGSDIINSSLGYTVFDDPSQDHTYEDMDGNTAIITKGADIAASKGILVVNSAGNSGWDPWYYIGAPADGDSVFSIGAVSPDSILAGFSSHGPTFDGRIKPNVVAQGAPAVVASSGGGFSDGYGTSFSSPIMAGMCACLWQTKPDCNNMDIINVLQQSGHYADSVNNDYGYGIPDFEIATNLLSVDSHIINSDNNIVNVSPNPCSDNVKIVYNSGETQSIAVNIYDMSGSRVLLQNTNVISGKNIIKLRNIKDLRLGTYIIRITGKTNVSTAKLIKMF